MRISRLSNGVRVLSEAVPDLPSVTLGIWVENGSRYEDPAQAGISHFLEHLFFKGTSRRTAVQIAEEIDAVGGMLNAFTGKEYTCYYAKVLCEHMPLALDVLADIFTGSRFAEEEIDRERTVILQEISQVEDTPDDWVHDLFGIDFWPGHPLARPIAGTAETVGGLHRSDFITFLGQRYRPDRVLVAAAGHLEHDALVQAVDAAFGGLTGTTATTNGVPPAARRFFALHEKPLEQLHVCLGMPGIAQRDPARYAVHLMNIALGGGMSSRLFQEVREKRGKAYSVYSFLSSYRDAGYLGVYVGTSPEWVHEVLGIIQRELRRMATDGMTPAELQRTKNQMKGNMLLGLETSDSRMSRIAKSEIYHGRDVTIDEIAAAIDAVGHDDVLRVAQQLLGEGARACTVLGDLRGQRLDDGVLDA